MRVFAMPNSSRPISVITPLSERIGLRYPLVSAPMFLISTPEMLVSSAEAGILGAMPSLNGRSHEDFRAMLKDVSQATERPYAINLTIGLTDPERRIADLHACIDFGVKVLITSYGNPTEIVQEAHRHGMIVLHDVISLKHALKAQAAGVDAVIGVSAGAGGHAGTVSPFAFIPWLKSTLDIPIVAAGSISTGQQVLSALSLGADLCYMGTRFIVSDECSASESYKSMVKEATPEEITYTDAVSGIHANFLTASLPEEGPRTRESPRKRWRDIWSAGHGVAQIKETAPLHSIVDEVMTEYHQALCTMNDLTQDQAEMNEIKYKKSDSPSSSLKIPLQYTPRVSNEYFNLTEILLDTHINNGRGTRTALVCPEGYWTYVSVYFHTLKHINSLSSNGIRPEDRVLIAVKDSADFVGAWLATIRFGAVAVMINPDLSAERIAELIEYSRAHLAFVEVGEPEERFSQALHSFNHKHQLTVVTLEGSTRQTLPTYPSQIEDLKPAVKTHRDDPAVWLFSGGTTGRPKAIIQPHRSFLYTTEHYALGVMEYGENDRTLSVPKLYFGYATGANLIFPMAAGGSTILFAERPTPDQLFELIQKHKPTILINVPTLINRMLKHPKAAEQDLSSLRAVTSAGEALPRSLYDAWSALYKAPLCDGLGTAEMWHIFLTNHPTNPDFRRTGTLGKVIDGFEISLRNPDNLSEEVEEGSPGVMWVKGGARALGYWQQIDASQTAFKGEWYASNDLMIRDHEGFYTFCGRSDDMIKVAGKFASPKEVEDQLMKHTTVHECAVVGREDVNGLMKLFAFITINEDQTQTDEQICAGLTTYLASSLDRYKLPKAIIILPTFPKTHLGKINRGILKVNI
jgi:benzoate-CoA ligase family protein